MKKVYQAPAIEVIEFEFESLLMAESNTGNLPGTGNGDGEPPVDGNGDSWGDANRHRGEWGDLWAED